MSNTHEYLEKSTATAGCAINHQYPSCPAASHHFWRASKSQAWKEPASTAVSRFKTASDSWDQHRAKSQSSCSFFKDPFLFNDFGPFLYESIAECSMITVHINHWRCPKNHPSWGCNQIILRHSKDSIQVHMTDEGCDLILSIFPCLSMFFRPHFPRVHSRRIMVSAKEI